MDWRPMEIPVRDSWKFLLGNRGASFVGVMEACISFFGVTQAACPLKSKECAFSAWAGAEEPNGARKPPQRSNSCQLSGQTSRIAHASPCYACLSRHFSRPSAVDLSGQFAALASAFPLARSPLEGLAACDHHVRNELRLQRQDWGRVRGRRKDWQNLWAHGFPE